MDRRMVKGSSQPSAVSPQPTVASRESRGTRHESRVTSHLSAITPLATGHWPLATRRCGLLAVGCQLIALFALLPLDALAQTTRRNTPDTTVRQYVIRGSVRNSANDMTLEMVKVDLKRFTGETLFSAFTRSNGEFEFVSLSGGEYIIEINHPEFEPFRETIQLMNTSRIGVMLFLKPATPNGPVPAGGAVSARELTIQQNHNGAYRSFQKGIERIGRKDIAGSLRHFEKAAAEMPGYYEALHMKGVAYFEMGQLKEAEDAFQMAIRVSDSHFAQPYFALAALRTSAKQYAEAEAHARAGVNIDDRAWRGQYELARALMGQNRVAESWTAIQRARELNPEYPEIYLVSANINMRRQDSVALIKDLDEYLRLEPAGPYSEQARKMRDAVRARMAAQGAPKSAGATTPPPPR